jgi:crotonobetaine/carnitine-CoA ligase
MVHPVQGAYNTSMLEGQSTDRWWGPIIPTRETCVLRYVLESRAASMPNRIYVVFEDGTHWTYAEAWEFARQSAARLEKLELSPGDVIFVWLPNGPEFLKVWFGASFLGVIVAAPNIAYRGRVLQHLFTLADAKAVVVHHSLLEHLVKVDFGQCNTVVVVGNPATGVTVNATVLRFDALPGEEPSPTALAYVVQPWDTQFIIFTSGTTGPSKGVIVPYVQMYALSMTHFEGHLGADDRYLVNMPMFHVSGLLPAYGALLTGGSIAVVSQFKTDTFWEIIRKYEITGCTLVGAAASFLQNQAPSLDDANNPLCWVSMFPLLSDPPSFSRRFDVNITTAYGMSELSIPIVSAPNPTRPDSCGQLRPGYEARIVDEFDRIVDSGTAGELVLRAQCPWAITPGYWRDVASTAAAWRNGWFHTGDMFRCNADGDYFFLDRKKDSIRRRGENISSYEVELEILAHPAVAESAVIAVPSSQGEDEVMAVVVLKRGAELTHEALFEFLKPRMARFMLPYYIRFVQVLLKTPTLRVQKHLLREAGITSDTWNRLDSGIKL